MTLIQLVVVVALIGFGLWALNRYIPMQGTIKGILNFLGVVIVIVLILSFFGLLPAGLHIWK
jgi:hypothetical protein